MSPRRPIRLLLADVDGTLLTDGKVLTAEAKAAVRELRDAGIEFAITSSRPPRGLRMLFEPLALDNITAGLNGGIYVNPDLSVLRCHTLDPQTARRAVNLILRQGLDAWVYTDREEWLVRDPTAPHVERERWILQFDATIVETFSEAHLALAVKIVGVSDDFDLVAASEKIAQKALGKKASVARSQTYYLDVTHPQANKGVVVTTLSESLKIPPDRIATIGDMQNDVLMFRQSGLSIAMGNATDDVKAQASAATDSNENEGFAKAVRKLVLGQAAP